MADVRAVIRLSNGDTLTSDPVTVPPVTARVTGGFYVGGNGDVRPFTVNRGANLRSLTQYHSLAESGPSQYPGHQDTWRAAFVAGGGWLNLVSELRTYGIASAASTKALTVEDRRYAAPSATAAVQLGKDLGPGLPAWDYLQVLAGSCDGLIHQLLAALRAIPVAGRINVQIYSELDTDVQYGYRGNGIHVDKATAQARAVAAASYIINWMRNPPAGVAPVPTGVTFTMGWAGQRWSGMADYLTCHPDSLPVDYAQWNMYHRNTDIVGEPVAAMAGRLRETLAYHRACGPVMRAKDILIAEWGVSADKPGGQGAYIRAMPQALNIVNREQVLRGEGQYRMANYFSSRDRTWGKLDPEDAGVEAIRDAYAGTPFRS